MSDHMSRGKFAGGIAALGSIGLMQADVRAAEKAKYTWRYASQVALDNFQNVSTMRFIERVRARTKGAVNIQMYPSSQLGNEADVLKNIQNGTIQLSYITSSSTNAAAPETILFALPYVFKDATTIHKAINGPAKDRQEAQLEGLGLKILAWRNAGARHIGAKQLFPIPDMKGTKIRVIQSPMFISLFKAFNAVPTPLSPADVYSALQQGLVSAYDQPLDGMITFKWYEVANQVTLSSHTFSAQMLTTNKELWESLPKDIKAVLMEAAAENAAEYDAEQQKLDARVLADLKSRGATVLAPDLGPWRKAAATIYPQFAAQIGGMAVLEKLIASQ